MGSDALSVVWTLAAALKNAYEGVPGNKEQCKLLNDQVQHVATALKGLPLAAREKPEIVGVVGTLAETLRSATGLIAQFKSVGWFKKVLSHASITAKFEALFVELDRVLTVCGFALEVSDK
jgi:hypothetical protein